MQKVAKKPRAHPIRLYMARKGIPSIEQVAPILGVHQTDALRYVKWLTIPHLSRLWKLCDLTGSQPCDWLPDKPNVKS